jgi:hypothetical protein
VGVHWGRYEYPLSYDCQYAFKGEGLRGTASMGDPGSVKTATE